MCSSDLPLGRAPPDQWGAVFSRDVADGVLRPVATAPLNYPGACCVANSAVLYQKTSK